MYQTLIQKIEEHASYGPAMRQAASQQTPMVLHVHAHDPRGAWCVAVLAERPLLLDLLGEGNQLEELVHVAGFAPDAAEGEARARALAQELREHYALQEEPRVDVEPAPLAPEPPAGGTHASPAPRTPGGPAYDPAMVQPMRDEVTRLGVEELRTPAEVDQAFARPGTTLVFVNSVCGCAAGGARPGLALALQGAEGPRPDHLVTLFAGMEREAVAHARERFRPYQPSSPQFALLKDGQLVHMWQRQDIEGRDPETIARSLVEGFAATC